MSGTSTIAQIFVPLMRPISGNGTLPTPVHILLRILSYHIGIVNLRK